MRRRLFTLLLVSSIFVTGGVFAGCGGDDSGSSADGSPATAADLAGRTFVATGVEGQELVPDSKVSFVFKGDTLNVTTGCNGGTGRYEVKDGVLTLGKALSTLMGCPQELMAQDKWILDFLETGAETELNGDDLTLTGGDVTLDLSSS